MPKQKILYVINSLELGGAEILLLNTIRLLSDFDHVIVTLTDVELAEALPPNIIKRYCLHFDRKIDFPKAYNCLKEIIRVENPILVHAHLQLAGLLAKLACPKKIPLFYTLHSPYSIDAFSQNRFSLLAERFSARSYHHIIGVSGQVIDDYNKYVPNCGTTDVLYNFVSDKFYNVYQQHNYNPGSPLRCISVGNLKRAKNYFFTLENFKLLKDSPITLDIYGAGEDERTMKDFIKRHNLTNVRMAGRTLDIDLLFKNYDLYIINSTYEGFGIAPLEAMAAGLPVVASNIPIFKEIIDDGGIYVDLDDPSSLSVSLQDIYKGSLNISSYSQKGRNRTFDVATASVYLESLLKIYNKYLQLS